jgi:hypothetical protein
MVELAETEKRKAKKARRRAANLCVKSTPVEPQLPNLADQMLRGLDPKRSQEGTALEGSLLAFLVRLGRVPKHKADAEARAYRYSAAW